MKNALLSLVILGSAMNGVYAQTPPDQLSAARTPAPATVLMQEAYKKADAGQKAVFVLFHASWCTWCHKMDESMNDKNCKDYFDKSFEIVHIVVAESNEKKELETPGGEEMLKQYYGDGQGIPYWLIFDSKGNLLADSRIRKATDPNGPWENTGCPATAAEVDHFIAALKKSAAMSAGQETKIRARFRSNEVK
jgi:thioredoxin-related protein